MPNRIDLRRQQGRITIPLAIGVEQQAVALGAGLEANEIGADQRLDQGADRGVIGLGVAGGIVEHNQGRTHVRDVEQSGAGPRPQMLFQHPVRILDRPVVAGERRHARAQRPVRRGQRRRFQLGGRGSGHGRTPGGDAFDETNDSPPLSLGPERFRLSTRF